jgi:tetratricopeptide (TPR) repeat protein
MAWSKFPYPDDAYEYTPVTLEKAWGQLHAGDVEPFPGQAALVDAWRDFHAGRFEAATHSGLKQGMGGYTVAAKATCIHANYLETGKGRKQALFDAVVARCEELQAAQPDNANGYYWHAYALGRRAQSLSVLAALSQGIGSRIRHSLETVLSLAPEHADAHIALGVYHAEVVTKVGGVVAGLTYGASREASIRHFERALALNPDSAIAHVEYANALAMLDRKDGLERALDLCTKASGLTPRDAMERLDIELARQELKE